MSTRRKPTKRVDQDELTAQWLCDVFAVCLTLFSVWLTAWCLVTM